MKFLLVIVYSLVSLTGYAQSNISALERKLAVDSVASTIVSDSKFYILSSSDVDSSGLSAVWRFGYISETQDTSIFFNVYKDSIVHSGFGWCCDGNSLITGNVLDSDEAIDIAKENGANEFIINHSTYSIEASLYFILAPPFVTYWKFNFKDGSEMLVILMNAETGEITNAENIEEKYFNYYLEQNYPNPFNPNTKISYEISKTGNVVLKVFDILGNEVGTLVNDYKNPGKYEVEFYAEKNPSGVYFYVLEMNSFIRSKKMILIK